MTPSQIRLAYGINSISVGSVTGDGTGQTIAIIDAYDDPDIVNDLAAFSTQFGLQQFNPGGPTFTKFDQNGGTIYPGTDPTGGWEQETSLDVEWAHAIAPKANLVLLEAASGGVDSPSFTALMTAVNTARSLPDVSVISMSFGFPEASVSSWFGQGAEVNYDQSFTTPSGHIGITYVASSGDSGAPGCYPGYSPNVLAVGGTKLTVSGNYASEVGWSLSSGWGSGGGQSGIEGEPSYQLGVQSSGGREIPDVSMEAANPPGAAVYCSYNTSNPSVPNTSTPWIAIGGTSLSAPCWASLVAIADQLRGQGIGFAGRPVADPARPLLPRHVRFQRHHQRLQRPIQRRSRLRHGDRPRLARGNKLVPIWRPSATRPPRSPAR